MALRSTQDPLEVSEQQAAGGIPQRSTQGPFVEVSEQVALPPFVATQLFIEVSEAIAPPGPPFFPPVPGPFISWPPTGKRIARRF